MTTLQLSTELELQKTIAEWEIESLQEEIRRREEMLDFTSIMEGGEDEAPIPILENASAYRHTSSSPAQ